MKKNLLYLAGFILTIASCSNEDTPTYVDIQTDQQTLTVDLDKGGESTMSITQGNGNYKTTIANEDIATATTEGNTIKVTGLQPGETDLTITDWARKTNVVKIVVKKLVDLVLTKNDVTILEGKNSSIEVYTGNGNYQLSIADQSIATATIDTKGSITINALKTGNTTITITDEQNKNAVIAVKVIKELIVDRTEIINNLCLGEDIVVNILDGNGDYTASISSTLYANCKIEGSKVTIFGVKRGKTDKDVIIADKEGRSVAIRVIFVDDPFEETTTVRYKLNGALSSTSYSVGQIICSEEFNMSRFIIKTTSGSGYGIEFEGNLTPGSKSKGRYFTVTKSQINTSSLMDIENCELVKTDNGIYWITFTQIDTKGNRLDSYIVTKQSN